MKKKVFKFFLDPLEGQEKWLNKMADKGFRLIRTTRLSYEFETCNNREYQYRVEFVGEQSTAKLKDYRTFLEDMNIRSITKNINIKYALGAMRWRPWGKGLGMIATSPGNINKELLILERKQDGKPFELHTDLKDLTTYYSKVRNGYLWSVLMLFILLLTADWAHIVLIPFRLALISALILLILFNTFLVIKYSLVIHSYKEKQKTNE